MSVTFILGIANLIGGLPLIFHNVMNFSPEVRPLLTQAWRWSKVRLYMVLAPLSHMVFGLLLEICPRGNNKLVIIIFPYS
ncbi:hypothetical protein ZWY2020_045722 [Hordeum vulgare]|nr:hypothetical protein ZWY2020_045722 [Hordeum vulgare]